MIADFLRSEPMALAVLLSIATGCIGVVLAMLIDGNRGES